ncbi:MAG: hypothetical protein KDC34_07330, partial [Saprospiraceae bacterium]|nr:hypothetical protein [Saprospiraceae bacterium]
AERTAIIEMWGEYIGDTYTDRQYGIDHSLADNIASPTTQQIEARRWIYEAELAPIIPQGDPDGWIPWGLVYDLVDDNSTNPTSPAVNDPAGTSDMVGGFATVDILAAISIGLELTVEVRNELIQNFLPTGQSAVGVITLFNVYDW